MHKLFPYIAAVLLYAFTPGLCELAEVAVHFADTGDLHTSDSERHAEHEDSEGTNGECHTCFCHAPTAFMAPLKAIPIQASPNEEIGQFSWIDGHSDDTISELFRPPIA